MAPSRTAESSEPRTVADDRARDVARADPNLHVVDELPVDERVPSRILVVEDEHLVALDIQMRLQLMGHVAVIVHSGEEAVTLASETRFDLVLMDIKLEGALDGIEAARAVRNKSDVPIIYLTAYADNQTLHRARVTEPYGYVLKPFHDRELIAAIDVALQRHRKDVLRWEQEKVQQFLADASERMNATLNYREVALSAAELLVPRFADWCTIRLKETDDLVPSFAYTRPHRHSEPGGLHEMPLIETVLRKRRSELVRQIADPQALSDALGVRNIVELRACGARSLIGVPLIARDQILGALVLVAGDSRPRYGANDLMTAEGFAHRLGAALMNALLYRKAEQAARMRGDALAIVSHDLRTPLSTILLQSDVVSDHPEVRDAGRSIARCAHRISDLLDAASSVDAGRLGFDRKVHPVEDLLCDAVELLGAQAECKAIELVAEPPAEPMYVACDRDRIVQVLSNLIGNALDFSERGGKVAVRAERGPSGIRIEVCFAGRGRPRHSGAGAGLFIARGIIAAHGSNLDLGTGPGEESRLFFVLPEARMMGSVPTQSG